MKYSSIIPVMALALVGLAGGCSKGKSYSELLREEERATNWYLSGQRVVTSVPADSVLETGPDAPYYRLDNDGYVYMQAVELGDTSQMIKAGDVVYFRFKSWDIEQLKENPSLSPGGNANGGVATSFVYGNTSLSGASNYGSGIQMPLQFVGNYSEVNLVLRSYYGFPETQSECIPYLMNVKYFKAEY